MRYSRLNHVNNHGWPHLYAYLSEMAAVLKESKYAHSERFMVTEGYPDTPNPIEEYLAFYEGMDPEVAAPFNFEGLSLPWEAKPWRTFLSAFHAALDDYSPLCVASYAFGNHDQPRLVTRRGEPISRSAAVLLLTLPGMVFIYNGDEIGMKNGEIPPEMVQDPGAIGGGGRDPERTPMQWTDGKHAGFSTAHRTWLPIAGNYKTHNVAVESEDPDSFLTLYRNLGKLRNSSDSLRHGAFKVLDIVSPDVVAFSRSHNDESHMVYINFSDKAVKVTVPPEIAVGRFVLSSDPNSLLQNTHNGKLQLLAHEAAIFKV